MIQSTNSKQSFEIFSITCVASVVGLLIIWVLPNTIALRNFLLAISCLSSLVIVYKSKFFTGRKFSEMAPVICLPIFFLWVLIHYYFFSLDIALEFKELSSIWVRVLGASITAIGLCISLRAYSELKPYFFMAIFAVVIINLGAYIFLSLKMGSMINPRDFVFLFVFKKIEAAFFGVIAISIACANLLVLISRRGGKKFIFYIFLWLTGITVAIVSAIVANTKNGVAVGLGLCILFLFTLFYKALFRGNYSKLGVLFLSFFILILLASGLKVHSHFASQGWSTLFEDAKISSQLDQHNFWRYNSANWRKVTGESFPKNHTGEFVAGNTYERVSWATEGLILISQYPMGYGSINRSFVGLLNHAKIPNELDSQTHSGWIDFGLAFGIPGLLLLFTIFLLTLWRGINQGGQFGLMGVWLILGFIPFGLVAEICYKHNFEILIFFVSFAAASSITYRREFKS